MSDGREAIDRLILHIYTLGMADGKKDYPLNVDGMISNFRGDLEREFRADDWIRLDDVVEGGKRIKALCKGLPIPDVCPMKQTVACSNCPQYTPTRPATVKDLIG